MAMRSEHEIRRMVDHLETPPRTGCALLGNWDRSAYEAGYLMGKLAALGWVLGNPSMNMEHHAGELAADDQCDDPIILPSPHG